MIREELELAEDLNAACMEAAEACPQCLGYWNSRENLRDGSTVTVAKLHKSGLFSVINYWNSPYTIGGSLLNELGYIEELPEEYINIFTEYNSFMRKATKEFCQNYFV